MVIKPSGVLRRHEAKHMVIVSARGRQSGEGNLKPVRHGRASSLYRAFRKSAVWFTRTAFNATSWAQALPAVAGLRTTQADYW